MLKCTQFCQGTLYFNLEFNHLLQNFVSKQRYMTLNATISCQGKKPAKNSSGATITLNLQILPL